VLEELDLLLQAFHILIHLLLSLRLIGKCLLQLSQKIILLTRENYLSQLS